MIDHISQYDFICARLDVVHLGSPSECVVSLQSFVYAAFLGKARNYVIEHRVSLKINGVKVFV